MTRRDLAFLHETHQRPVEGCQFCHQEFGPPPWKRQEEAVTTRPTVGEKVDAISKAIHENAHLPSTGDVAVEILRALDQLEPEPEHNFPEHSHMASIFYVNHRGERYWRTIRPRRLFFGVSDYYPDPQWLLEAFDCINKADRTFSMANILSWRNVTT